MKRGDIVTVAIHGDYCKPRPALIIQSDLFDEHPSITVLPITSELRTTPLFRILIKPDSQDGLHKPSQVMVDKTQTILRYKLGTVVERVDNDILLSVNRALAVFLGIA